MMAMFFCNIRTSPTLMNRKRLEERACAGPSVPNGTATERSPTPKHLRRGRNDFIINEMSTGAGCLVRTSKEWSGKLKARDAAEGQSERQLILHQ